MLTIITPTGERPEAFEICQKLLQRQNYRGAVHWIVVDDGQKPLDITLRRENWRIDVLRPEPFWKRGDNTQGRNIIAGMAAMDPDASPLTIWEDDDYYAQDWLQWLAENAGEAELIGEDTAIYYNPRLRRWGEMRNKGHASLRCSAMSGDAIETFRDVLRVPDPFYDLKLWSRHGDKKLFPRARTIGMKGLPGRAGIAPGHTGFSGKRDPELQKLRELIGDDADLYADFYKENETMAEILIVATPFDGDDGRHWREGQHFTAANKEQVDKLIEDGFLARKTFVDKPAQRSARRAPKIQNQTAKLAEKTVTKASDKPIAAAKEPSASLHRGRKKKADEKDASEK